MDLDFEWDQEKAWRNLLKHRVSFDEAATVFIDPRALTLPDEAHSLTEDRYKTIGMSVMTRMLLVVHTERGERFRLISARRASAEERQLYETQTR